MKQASTFLIQFTHSFVLLPKKMSFDFAFRTYTNFLLIRPITSKKTFLRLLEKVRTFDEVAAGTLIARRDYQALDQMVIDHLVG